MDLIIQSASHVKFVTERNRRWKKDNEGKRLCQDEGYEVEVRSRIQLRQKSIDVLCTEYATQYRREWRSETMHSLAVALS